MNYKNRQSIRLSNYDYSTPGHYFVTICVKNMCCVFGRVIDQKMRYSPIGQIVAEEWIKTGTLRSNIELDQWIIMPNHIHGIIIIDHKIVRATQRVAPAGLFSNSLGSIIGQFKSACTKRIWAAGYRHFRWQRNYHDHIIRNERSLNNIREYIQNNPSKWDLDEYNPKNHKNVRAQNPEPIYVDRKQP